MNNQEEYDVNDTTLLGAEDKSYIKMEFAIQGVCVTMVAVAGIIANILCLIILHRPTLQKSQGSVNRILMAMAAIDILVVFCSILMCGLPGIALYSLMSNSTDNASIMLFKALETFFPYTIPYIYPIGLTSQTASVYLTVLVTIERFIAVCHPLKAKSLCSKYRTNTMITVCMVFSILYNFSRFFEYTYKEEDVMDEFSGNDSYVEDHHRVITRLVTTSVRQNYYYITFYIIWVYLFVMYFIPFSVLLSLNWKIWTEIKQAKIRRATLRATRGGGGSFCRPPVNPEDPRCGDDTEAKEKEEQRQHQLALMLIVVVVVFMLCNILAIMNNILEAFQVSLPSMVFISNLLVTLNSSLNLFIYSAFAADFRKEFKKILQNCLCKTLTNIITFPFTLLKSDKFAQLSQNVVD